MTDRTSDTDPAPPNLDEMTPRTQLGLQRLAIAKVEVVRAQLDRATDKLDRVLRALERVEANQTLANEEAHEVNMRLTRLEQRVDNHLRNGGQT